MVTKVQSQGTNLNSQILKQSIDEQGINTSNRDAYKDKYSTIELILHISNLINSIIEENQSIQNHKSKIS